MVAITKYLDEVLPEVGQPAREIGSGLLGRVHAIDELAVTFRWNDGTQSSYTHGCWPRSVELLRKEEVAHG